jgi:hypothetical protein
MMAVTQPERSLGQRRGAREVSGILGANQWLPAIGWSVSRAGNLSGLINGVVPPRVDPGNAFRIWRHALAMDDKPAVPARGGCTRWRACASRGPVQVSLTADVPGEAGAPAGETALPGGLIRAGSLLKPACALRGILDEHRGIEAIAWSVLPGKGLVAVIGIPGPAAKTREVFGQWQRALGLHDVREGPRGRDGGVFLRGRAAWRDVPVTVGARVRPGQQRALANGGPVIAQRPSGPVPGTSPSPRM